MDVPSSDAIPLPWGLAHHRDTLGHSSSRSTSGKISLMGTTDFASVFDRLYGSAPDERDKGTRFERLVKRYQALEPRHADQFSDVWLWSDRPGRNG